VETLFERAEQLQNERTGSKREDQPCQDHQGEDNSPEKLQHRRLEAQLRQCQVESCGEYREEDRPMNQADDAVVQIGRSPPGPDLQHPADQLIGDEGEDQEDADQNSRAYELVVTEVSQKLLAIGFHGHGLPDQDGAADAGRA